MRADYIRIDDYEIHSTDTYCCSQECMEMGCAFPHCSKDINFFDTKEKADSYEKELLEANMIIEYNRI